MTTATLSTGKTLEILPCLTVDGWLCRIDGDVYYVRDFKSWLEFEKEDGTVHRVIVGQNVFGCDCKGNRYRGNCRHKEAARAIFEACW